MRFRIGSLLLLGIVVFPAFALGQAPSVTFRDTEKEVEVFDFAEVVILVQRPAAANPFRDITVRGELRGESGQAMQVDGFCDAADGSLYRVRFMPSRPGRHDYTVKFQQGDDELIHRGHFIAVTSDRKGMLRIDPEDAQHFIWEGTGEHYFWNGTTTYYLMGWDDATIRRSIDRLADYRINRLRVLLYGRNKPEPWGQPVVPTSEFSLHLNPWPAARPDDVENPGFDLTRFNVDHWQKYERLLRYAREKDMIVSVIFFIGGQVLPTPFAAGSAEEELYYRYGVARLAAFSNVTWDLGNEYNFHREAPAWADEMGGKVKQWDPYDHLCSAHNVTHRTPRSTWCDMQLIQRWDDGQNAFMLGQCEEQRQTGRMVPQINEEYGYEDLWEKTPGQRRADTRRRCAWEIVMAGCYQTTGESARTGTGVAPDRGGGWVNGRGDDSMIMLRDYRHMVDFFTSFPWWKCRPSNELVESRLPCLACQDQRYVVYLPDGGRATIQLAHGKYRARWFNPRTGEYSEAGVAVAPVWTSPDTLDDEDWALLLERDDAAVDRAQAADVEQWGVMELVFQGPCEGNPYVDVHFAADFRQEGESLRVAGFYDGDGNYKIRFSPPSPGVWKYETTSNCPDLQGHRGEVSVGPPAEGHHGPVQVFQTYYLRYADGSSYHQFGTTCYAWIHQTEELQHQTLETLAASPFNKIRFCIFPKSYAYNQNEPALFAFAKKVDGTFDFDRPDPAFWHHLERRILELQRLGIEADLILWHPYDRWGFADMSDAQDDRYLRYCIARLSAYRNVWWSLANEFDFMTDRPAGHRGNKQMDDWDRFFQILRNEDAHARMRGIHNGRVWYDHTRDWVTHASLQTSDMAGGVGYRAKYQKPVIYDECRYEGNIPQGWGNLDARTMTQRFWLGTLSGCYVGHGETYLHPQDILWWSKGGVLHGESPQRIAWLKDFLTEAPPFHALEPLGDGQGRYLLARPGEYYLLYCTNTAPQSLELEGDRSYKVDLVDPWEMSVLPVGSADPGEYSVQPVQPDVAYRFTPYLPGERRRPEMKIEASVTEGVPPLRVTFRSRTEVSVAWDFGDGAVSEDNPVTHVFEQPGFYRVTLRATGPDAGSAVDFLHIAVDRDNQEPIVRVGYADEESASVTCHGTARVSQNGAFVLPDGQPWGRVQVGDGVLEDLKGLRSFTILGWVKPESLKIGSGGNRILFCLNKDRAGIDLVCHPDGRLRMSVNQWPDSVQNDSSPGKLVVGKWTRFAVTYDATNRSDNVCWYFGPPQDQPVDATLVLDRVTTYNAGPVAGDMGPLAIGNFNETMRDYGWDRQFRGEIRKVEIYGSRVSSRGAKSLAEMVGSE